MNRRGRVETSGAGFSGTQNDTDAQQLQENPAGALLAFPRSVNGDGPAFRQKGVGK
jgi:hypothetical protein